MNTITFLPWARTFTWLQPAERTLRMVGWNRDRSALLVYNEDGDRTALRLRLPSLCGIQFHAHPIPASEPVAVRRVLLHVLPCRRTQEDAEAIKRDIPESITGPGPKTWERYALAVLSPSRDDDPELHRRLRQYQKANPGASGVSLSNVKAGAIGIRDEYLAEESARRLGFELAGIREAALCFRCWLKAVAFNTAARGAGGDMAVLDLIEWQWQCLEAKVRYEMQFQGAGSIWADDVQETTVTTIEDLEDFMRLEEAAAPDGRESVTPQQCMEALGVGTRQLRNLCRNRGVDIPKNRGQLDALVKWHQRRRRHLDEQLAKRNRDTAKRKRERVGVTRV